jgi:aminopeptidase N
MKSAAPAVRENLTRDEARERATRIGAVTTTVHLDLTTGPTTFGSRTELTFDVHRPGSTFVDLTAVSVERLELDGRALDDGAIAPTRIALEDLTEGRHTLVVVATMAYRHEGKGLHRFVDPADDRVYLHSQFQPFDAHTVYACFDQPDLKTEFRLSVDAPEEWVVVSNTAAADRPEEGAAGRWVFHPTQPISTYITAVVAGSYDAVRDTYERADGTSVDLGLYVRRSLAEHLDADELFELTRQSFGALETMFGQPYPFEGPYDQLFVPEFSAGAMENPGCVTFSESYVFRSKVTDAQRERRAETLIHEMAHMWFGDLVTMRWWDDLWLNESFATFTSVFVQATATRWRDAWVTFLDSEKTWGKFQDQLPSTHPVAGTMEDVESVHQNFDGITYAKGAAVLRQLVAWVGEEEFLAGCRAYFDEHAWGNTELSDFLGALERKSGRDLAAWRDEWLRTTGLTTLEPRFQVADDGTYTSFRVRQTAPVPSFAELPGLEDRIPALRRHRVAVGLYDRTDHGVERTYRVELDVDGAETEVAELVGLPAADLVLVNDDDLTYAKTVLDAGSMQVATDALSEIDAPLARALVWSATWDMVRDGVLPAGTFVDLVRHNVASEDQVGVLQRLLLRAVGAVERYGDPARREERTHALAVSARAAVEAAEPGSGLQLAWVRHWAAVGAHDPDQVGDVARVLDGDLELPGLTVDTDLRWHLLTCLARRGAVGDERIDAELARDDTDLGRRQAMTARAAQPTAEAKAWAWEQLLEDTSLSHTLSRQLWTGFAQLDQREVLAPYTDAYLAGLPEVWRTRSLDWAIEFSAGMFPHWAADGALLERVDTALADDGLTRPLRRVLLEQRDTLVRTIAARALDAATSRP